MKEVSPVVCKFKCKFQFLNVRKLAAPNIADPVNGTARCSHSITFAVERSDSEFPRGELRSPFSMENDWLAHLSVLRIYENLL
jgi:hypothetical protein